MKAMINIQQKHLKWIKLMWFLISFSLVALPYFIGIFYKFSGSIRKIINILIIFWFAFILPLIPRGIAGTYRQRRIQAKEWEQKLLAKDSKYFLKRYLIIWATMLFLTVVGLIYKKLS